MHDTRWRRDAIHIGALTLSFLRHAVSARKIAADQGDKERFVRATTTRLQQQRLLIRAQLDRASVTRSHPPKTGDRG